MPTNPDLAALSAAATQGEWIVTGSDLERFWQKVDVRGQNECWEWRASATRQGYGEFGLNGKVVKAHRLSLILATRPPAPDLVAMHKCDNPRCVNPAHLEWGTRADNNDDMWAKSRGRGIAAENASKTHCMRGHELTGENLRMQGTWRICRQCNRDKSREYMRKRRASI